MKSLATAPTSPRGRVALLALVLALGAPATIAASPLPVTTRSDLIYRTTTEGLLRLDLYRPRSPSRLPVLILVHGGSWRRGDKSDWERAAPAFARQGFLVVAPNYSLAPPGGSTTFPAPVDDLRGALRWAHRNARSYGGDPRRVAMLGTSAGAHLTLLVASTGRTRPGAVALYSPPVDLEAMHAGGVAAQAIEALLGCGPDLCPDSYTAASGLYQIDPSTSPVFLAYSTDEVLPVEQGRRLDRRLREVGIRHRSHELDGTAHGLAAGRQVFEETVSFLKRVLNDAS